MFVSPHPRTANNGFEVRTKRVKEARDEAKKEIDAYKANKEKEYQTFEAEVCFFVCQDILLRKQGTGHANKWVLKHTQGNKAAADEANKDAEVKIREIQTVGKKSQDNVVSDLLKAVFDVNPIPPSAT
jgi:V-type H+-transporting ATPase subunit G